MPADGTAAAAAATVTRPLGGALVRYRVIAWVVGVGLITLVLVGVPLKYLAGQQTVVEVVGPLHGFLYMGYLALAIDLAFRARWSLRGTLLVLLAGTVPFLSFVAERIVTSRVRAGRPL